MAGHFFTGQRFAVPVLNPLGAKLIRRYPGSEEIGTEAHDNISLFEMVVRDNRFTKTILVCLYDTGIRYGIISDMFCRRELRNKFSDHSQS